MLNEKNSNQRESWHTPCIKERDGMAPMRNIDALSDVRMAKFCKPMYG